MGSRASTNARQDRIRQLLREDRSVRIGPLAETFGVSTMTVRRDIEQLERTGVLARTFGGAIALGPAQVAATSPAKRAIGRLAATLVSPGSTVLLDAGTTTLEVARALVNVSGITLITNSLPAIEATRESGTRAIALGGYVSHSDRRVYGPLTQSCLSGLHADTLFVGCVGADARIGFYMSDLHLTSNVQAMMRAASRVVLVAESCKFGQRSLSLYATPGEVHVVVTDNGLADQQRQLLEERGISVRIAQLDD